MILSTSDCFPRIACGSKVFNRAGQTASFFLHHQNVRTKNGLLAGRGKLFTHLNFFAVSLGVSSDGA